MLKDIPYDILKQDNRAYEIMLLRDQHKNTYTELAREYNVAVSRISQIYNKIKIKQIHLYINHIAVALGHEDTSIVKKSYEDAYECYQNFTYACAYLEKKYKAILDDYRAGEPGMPSQFIKNMPTFKPQLSQKTIDLVIKKREVDNASFTTIAKELHMTQFKAMHTYEMFYHKKVMELLDNEIDKTVSFRDQVDIINKYIRGNSSYKKRYDMLMKDML